MKNSKALKLQADHFGDQPSFLFFVIRKKETFLFIRKYRNNPKTPTIIAEQLNQSLEIGNPTEI